MTSTRSWTSWWGLLLRYGPHYSDVRPLPVPPPQIGDLNSELDKLVAIANSWKDTGEERKRVTEEQASVIRGLMQARRRVSLAPGFVAPCKRKGLQCSCAAPHGFASCHCLAELTGWLAFLPACACACRKPPQPR